MTKDFRGSIAAAKAWLRGGFCPEHDILPLQNHYATTVRPCNLRQNRRATGARIWGSVQRKTISAQVLFFI